LNAFTPAGTVLAVVSVGTSPGGSVAPAAPIRVLIADDEPALRHALAALFAHEDGLVVVGEAGDADQAIEIAGERLPDIALVDVNMPAGGGPRAAREILRVSPETRVIALSAFEDRPTVFEMLRAGAVGYLVKGTPSQDLLGSITKVFDGGASLSAEVIDGLVHELSSKLRREEIEQDQRAARRGEIDRFLSGHGVTMVFQPIVDLRSRAPVGLEALARFHSLPLRPPNEWFAEAVELELGTQLELMAIRTAMASIDRLPTDAYLSVNCSARAAMSPELAGLIDGHAARMVIEITEHEAIEDYAVLSTTLEELRRQGVRLAIDDAGAGFASLRHTLLLRPDIVKVDTSLTRDIDADRAKRALTSALVSFGEEMGVAIVAEGIETREELETLLALGVPFGQGFYLAPPAAFSPAAL
jgi:EAL domain-containing protein (putative c-di-GMP-specific phosphodiesterase class I)/AmiR/NasT family two-component response regulator